MFLLNLLNVFIFRQEG